MNFRPLHDTVLVELDDPPKMRGGLYIPDDAQINNVRTATVLRVGPGLKNKYGKTIPMGIETGEKVAFLRWHLEHQNGKARTASLRDMGENIGVIRLQDILFKWPRTEKVDVV